MNWNNQRNNGFLSFLGIVSTLFGLYNAYLNLQQIDNNTIMKKLNEIDTEYLKKIIKLLEDKGDKNDDNKQYDENFTRGWTNRGYNKQI